MRKYICLLFVVFMTSCATPYQSEGFEGGFSETQLDVNVFNVSFRGNSYTPPEQAADYTLLRSAELALMNGYNYFIVIKSGTTTKQSSYTTPTYTTGSASGYGNYAYGTATTTGGQTYYSSKPTSSNTIVCFKEKPEGFSFNANFIEKSIKERYQIDTP